MASEEEAGQTKSEAPTPRRREDARAEGNVAFRADLTSGFMLLCGLTALAVTGPRLAALLFHGVQGDLLQSARLSLDSLEAQSLVIGMLCRGLEIVGLFLAVMVLAALVIAVMQVGFHLTPNLLGLNLEKMSPAKGWGKLLARGNWVKGLISLLKVIVIGAVAWWVLRGRVADITVLSETPLPSAVTQAWSLVIRVGLVIAAALVTLGVADYAYQWWRLEDSLRMTRQELKEEMKRDEGDPQVKARVRKLQRDASQKQMMHDVPKASVVITNPTHLAIALRYDAGVMGAPRVVAKGAGLIAQRIAAIARQHGVPVLERKPLAQAIFKTVKIGQEIPAALYVAVAELLAHVYRMRNPGATLRSR